MKTGLFLIWPTRRTTSPAHCRKYEIGHYLCWDPQHETVLSVLTPQV